MPQFQTPYPIDPDNIMGGGSILPVSDENGWLVAITDSEFRQSQAGNTMVILHMTGQEGEAQGKTSKYRINLFHPDEKTNKIAQQAMNTVAMVCEVPSLPNTEVLHGKPFRVIVKEGKPNDEGKIFPEIKAFLYADGSKPKRGGGKIPPSGKPEQPGTPANTTNAFPPAGGQPATSQPAAEGALAWNQPQQAGGQPGGQANPNAGFNPNGTVPQSGGWNK